MQQATAALAAGDWGAAKTAFESALAEQESPEALAGLGTALWWAGETHEAVAAQERAYAAYRRRPDAMLAAVAAIELFFQYGSSLGNRAAAHGWLGRLARLVDQFDLEPMRGWVALCRAAAANDAADDAADVRNAEAHATEALETARAISDPDLELCALSELGYTLLQSGRVADGVALIDEAMAGALAGEGRRLQTVVFTGCRSITSCTRVLEVERATQWIRAADGFTRRYGNLHLYTTCRTHYGCLLVCQGRWAQAEQELRAALDMGRTGEPFVAGEALAKLAELRVAQGRLAEAAELLTGFEDHPACVFPRAQLYLRRGEEGVAATLLRRRLEACGPENVEAAPLRELAVEADIALGDLHAAADRAHELAEAGESTGCRVMVAHGQRASGRVELAVGEPQAAAVSLARALDIFVRIGMPFDAARTHLLLAHAARDSDPASSIAEARAALATFDELGAAADGDEAAAFLRDLGVRATRRKPSAAPDLTAREEEVLRLLSEGLSNNAIAQRLFLSRKTVEHHVRGLFTKLGIDSRAEAAAYAVRRRADGG